MIGMKWEKIEGSENRAYVDKNNNPESKSLQHKDYTHKIKTFIYRHSMLTPPNTGIVSSSCLFEDTRGIFKPCYESHYEVYGGPKLYCQYEDGKGE